MNSLASALTGVQGERVALTDVSITAALRDLLGEVTVSQTYRNEERVGIEAVYTFPLPLDAVLLDLQVDIGGRVLKGVVVEKQVAEERYETAIDSGDSAVMLEAIEPGLYTMNVGNLLPQESATITFTYAIVYRWAGDQLRFFLPTTVAPRFGNSPHLPHQAPETSLIVENQFSLQVEIFGSLRDAQFICPSHEVKLFRSADKTVISLQQERAVMDRDFVVNIKAPQAARSFVQCGSDGEGVAAIASFQPFFPGLQQPRALNLAIVIDCSGSMQGDSMEQAKQALEGIFDALQPQDRITLIAFGSTTSLLADRPLACSKTNLTKARRFSTQLDANMGGTEIGLALHDAYAALGDSGTADILVVTDGEVSSWELVVQEAKRSGHRIFTVGVGSAVSEAFVRELAASTHGECELVSPREGMADRVVRHFERMRAPRARRVAVHWPEGATHCAPSKLGAVFEGDTVIVSTRFEHPAVSGSVELEVETATGEIMRSQLIIPITTLPASMGSYSTVARLAAAARLKELDAGAGLDTALRYQLVSPWTNWLVIAERPENEKAQNLPELRKVPQTLAAGWGGAGMVSAPCLSMDLQGAGDILDMPSFLREMPAADTRSTFKGSKKWADDLPESLRLLLELIEMQPGGLNAESALALLRNSGLEMKFDDLFGHAIHLGLNIQVFAAIVLAEILGGKLRKYLSSDARRAAKELQRYARQEKDAMQEAGHLGRGLMAQVSNAFSHEVFRPEAAHATMMVLARLAEFRDLLESMQAEVKRVF